MNSPATETERGSSLSVGGRTEQWERDRAARHEIRGALVSLPTGFVVFADLALPKPSRATVDHLVVGPRNVWAVTTHVLDDPVMYGSGRNADTLWSGREPLRAMLEAADWEASTLSDQLGVAVEPMLCLVTPTLPEPAFDFHGIRITGPDLLIDQVAAPTTEFVDVPTTTAAIERRFGVGPVAGTAAPTLATATIARPSSAPPAPHAPVRRRSLGARLHAIRSKRTVRAIAVLAVVATILAFLPTILGLWTSVADEGAERLNDVIDEVGSDDVVGDATEAVSPNAARYELTCAAPGAGWTLEWAWPGTLPDDVAGYSIRTQVGDNPPVVHTLLPWSDPADPPPPVRIAASGTTSVFTDHRDADGRVVATTTTAVLTPTEPC